MCVCQKFEILLGSLVKELVKDYVTNVMFQKAGFKTFNDDLHYNKIRICLCVPLDF